MTGTAIPEARGIDVAAMFDVLDSAKNAMNAIILDACRENRFGKDFRVEQKLLSQLDARRRHCSPRPPGNVASDGEGSNGLYAEYLPKEIGVPEAKIADVLKRGRQ